MEPLALPDPSGFLDHLPGPALSGGVSLLAALIVLGGLANQASHKSKAERREFNRSIERAVGDVAGFIGRYLSGRELVGPPRSEATWWSAGAPLPDDQRTETPVDQLGAPPRRQPATSLHKTRAPGRLHAAAAAARGTGRALAGIPRVLRAWHRWPRAARAAVRLAPLPLAWGLWRFPDATCRVLIGAAVAVVLAALTGPNGLTWWRVAPVWTHGQIYGPGLWVVIRQILRMEDDEPRGRWLSVPDDMSAEDARITLRIPAGWMGGPEAVAAIERIVDERVPGEWVSRWDRKGREHFAQWMRKPLPALVPVLPEYVPWKSTGDPNAVFVGRAIEGNRIVDAVIQTKTATPHWGVAGDTGSGKSTVLYIPVVHGRQNGELIDILDTKRNSLREAEGFSGVRIHKTTRECIAAFAEFLVSMMAAEAAMQKDADPALREQLVPRWLVVDELPTLIKLAYSWWRYGLKGKGTPPFLDWLGIILLQGRSSDHRVVVGTQQFANAYFGGTMERAQIGTRLAVGQQDRISWGVAFGQNTPVINYDIDVKGRGAYSDKRRHPEGEHLYVREIQPCYITPDVAALLSQCPPAPEWFDAGQMAPWITPETLEEVNQTAATAAFLPGGKHGPESLPAVARRAAAGAEGSLPSSQDATGPGVTGSATADATAAGGGTEKDQEEAATPTYTLAEAHENGILPWKAHTTRTYRKRGEQRGIAFPEGISDGRTSYYSEEELTTWLAAWRKWQEENNATPQQRKASSGEEATPAQR